MPLHEKIHSGRSIRESVVQDYGSPGLGQWRVRTGNCSNRDGRIGKSPTCGCWRLVGTTPCSFREKSSFPKMSGLENPSDAKTKCLRPEPLLRHTNASPSFMMAICDECRGVVLRRFHRSSRTRPEHRDAWTKAVNRIVMNGQDGKFVQKSVTHEQKRV